MLDRPDRLLRAILILAVFAATALGAPPNVVFLLADDLGWRDLGCYGSRFYETPSLDSLASSGARFTQAYAACPVCSPTRASIMTGKYPVRIRVTDYISPSGGNQPESWSRNTAMLPSPYSDRMPLEETTLAEAFKENGYATFFAGKWHLGSEGHWPEDQGFDVNKGGWEHGGPWYGDKYFSPYGNPNLADGPPGEFLPERLAREDRTLHRRKPGQALSRLSLVLFRPHAADDDGGSGSQVRGQGQEARVLRAALDPGRLPRREAGPGPCDLRRDGRGPRLGGRHGPRRPRRQRSGAAHHRRLHVRQRRAEHFRRLPDSEPAPARRQGLDVRRRHPRTHADSRPRRHATRIGDRRASDEHGLLPDPA